MAEATHRHPAYSAREHFWMMTAYVGFSFLHLCYLIWHYFYYKNDLIRQYYIDADGDAHLQVKCKDVYMLRREGKSLLFNHNILLVIGIFLSILGPAMAYLENTRLMYFTKASKVAYFSWFIIRSAGQRKVLVPLLINFSGALVIAIGARVNYIINYKSGVTKLPPMTSIPAPV